MKDAAKNGSNGALPIQREARQIRLTARKIAASKQKAIRFLASTKMYSSKGLLKPQFS